MKVRLGACGHAGDGVSRTNECEAATALGSRGRLRNEFRGDPKKSTMRPRSNGQTTTGSAAFSSESEEETEARARAQVLKKLWGKAAPLLSAHVADGADPSEYTAYTIDHRQEFHSDLHQNSPPSVRTPNQAGSGDGSSPLVASTDFSPVVSPPFDTLGRKGRRRGADPEACYRRENKHHKRGTRPAVGRSSCTASSWRAGQRSAPSAAT